MTGPTRVDICGQDRTAALLATAGWSRFLERLLAGISHELNGRAMALDAIVHFVDAGRPVPPVFRQEVGRVQDLGKLLSLIPTSIDAPPIPVILKEALSPALRLHQGVAETDTRSMEIDVAADTPPVLVTYGRFLRALVIYMGLIEAPEDGQPWLRVTGDEGMAEIRGVVGDRDAHEVAWTSLEEIFALDSGHLRISDNECVLQLPSLSVARAAARAYESSGSGHAESGD